MPVNPRPSVGRAAAGLLLAVSAACSLLTFDVVEETTTEVPGAGLLGGVLSTLDLGGLDDFDVAIEQEIEDQGVAEGDLREVVVSAFVLDGDPDLGFLSSLAVFASADGVDEVEIGRLGDVADGERSAALTLTDADLTALVTAGAMSFRVEASGDAPADDTTLTARVTVTVTATAQGACRAAGDR